MKRIIGRLVAAGVSVWIAAALPMAAQAADVQVTTMRAPRAAPAATLPFPRSERAQAVWAADACWRECGAYCAWGQTACLARDTQGQCLKLTDDCDRYCQRNCRTAGGPWLPLDF